MTWLIPIVCLMPTLVESFLDRKGETKVGKRKDFYWFLVGSIGIAAVSYCFGQNVIAVLSLILGWRILVFDYLVQWLLIRNKVIVGHWFTYNGQTAKFDKLVSNINPWVRLTIRVLIFAAAVWYYTI